MDDEKVLITESTLDEIADAIREKNGETFKYYPREMPSAVRRIPTGTGGGSVVAVFPVLLSGTHIADIVVDGDTFELYAPTPKTYTQGTGIEISQNGVVSVSEALRNTINDKVDNDTFTTAINNLVASVASKQDLLTAGQNITIQGNVISATGGGASAVSDLTDVDLNDLADGQVLKWNATDEVWENADESGGTTVIANPTGTPTDELSTIRIGDTVYEIAGGGGSGYESTELWSGSPTISTITLSDSVLNYDGIYIEGMFNGEALLGNVILKETFESALGTLYIGLANFPNAYIGITPASTATSFVLYGGNTNGVTRIIGLKYGSGGGGGSSLPFDVVIDPNDDGINLVPDGGGGGGGSSYAESDKYSTTEKVIGEWINGKPLYQKTIYSATLGTGQIVPVAHGISNLGVVVSVEATCFDSGYENAWFPISHISTDGYNIGIFSVDGTNINFSNPTAFGARITEVYATIKYTKTTD